MTSSTVQGDPTWDPSQYVSYSSLNLHRQCPQAWAYRYLRGIERIEDFKVHADFGSWFHLVKDAETLERGHRLGSLVFTPAKLDVPNSKTQLVRVGDAPSVTYRLGREGPEITPSPSLILGLAKRVWERQTLDYQEAFIEALGEDLPTRLTSAFSKWLNEWAKDREHEEPLAVEFKFRRPLPDVPGEPVVPGYVDEIYRDTKRGIVVVRDTKTSSKLDAADAEDDLSDSQTHLYAWGVEEALKQYGLTVDAVAYDRVRSVAPKTPKVTTSGGLSASVKDYDLGTYLAWAAGPDGEGVLWGEEGEYFKSGKRSGEPKWGRYVAEEKEIARLSSPSARSAWFQRSLTPINRNISRAHVQAAVDTQQAAQQTVHRFKTTGEAPRNFNRRLCGWCDFRKLCRAELISGPGGDFPLSEWNLREKNS